MHVNRMKSSTGRPSIVEAAFTPLALATAWRRVRARSGPTPGADGMTLDAFSRSAARHLDVLAEALHTGTYRPRPLRRIEIKAKGRGPRRLDLPAVRDRVVQTALLLALQPKAETQLADAAFAYRPGRSHMGAARRLRTLCADGRTVVARGDVAAFFPSIRHAPLLSRLDDTFADPKLTALIALLLTTPVDGTPRTPGRGLPQGFALSPLLSNLYITPFDRAFERAGLPMVRYADDFAVACRSESAARHAFQVAEGALRSLRLYLNRRKSRVECAHSGVRFLGQTVRVPSASAPARPAPSTPTRSSCTPSASSPMPRPAPKMPPSNVPPHGDSLPRETALRLRPAPSPSVPGAAPRTLYVDTQGATVCVERERLLVRAPDGSTLLRVGLPRTERVVLLGTVHLTAGAAKRLLRAGVPVVLLSRSGRFAGRLAGRAATSAATVRAQCVATADPARRLAMARDLVGASLRASTALLAGASQRAAGAEQTRLRDEARRVLRAAHAADAAGSLEELRGHEGAAARTVFGALRRLFPEGPLAFRRRSRRPPGDPANAMLSFAYTLGHGIAETLAEMHHLHPYVGLYHEDRAGHATLASDLLELVRPSLTTFVLDAARREVVGAADFETRGGGGVYLAAAARRRFLRAFEAHLRKARAESGLTLWQYLAAQTAALAAHMKDPAQPFAPSPFL